MFLDLSSLTEYRYTGRTATKLVILSGAVMSAVSGTGRLIEFQIPAV